MKKIKHVAIAILLQQQNVLLAWRDERLHQGGCYEFAGGKIEPEETPMQACKRETLEEVGIELNDWLYVDTIIHEYDDVIVHLYIYKAYVPLTFNESIHTRWQWVKRPQLLDYTFPSANKTIIEHLIWQPYIKISHNLTEILNIKQNDLFYWRIDLNENLQPYIELLEHFATHKPSQLKYCIINHLVWQSCSSNVQSIIRTVHLTQEQCMNFTIEQKITGLRYLVACHDTTSLDKALEIGADAVFCSPIFATKTHPEQHQTLGWQTLSQWIKNYPIPVFALGGLKREDLNVAQSHGAYGIAGIRGL